MSPNTLFFCPPLRPLQLDTNAWQHKPLHTNHTYAEPEHTKARATRNNTEMQNIFYVWRTTKTGDFVSTTAVAPPTSNFQRCDTHYLNPVITLLPHVFQGVVRSLYSLPRKFGVSLPVNGSPGTSLPVHEVALIFCPEHNSLVIFQRYRNYLFCR